MMKTALIVMAIIVMAVIGCDSLDGKGDTFGLKWAKIKSPNTGKCYEVVYEHRSMYLGGSLFSVTGEIDCS